MLARKPWHLAVSIALLLACLGAVLPSAAAAQGPLPWRGEYFDNQNLTGQPVRIRSESAVNYDWGANAPVDSIPSDHFSARWTAYLTFDEGTYLFKTYTDDAVRLWIDGQLLIDQWHDQSVSLYQQQIAVSGGYHSLRMEYYDNIGNAVAMLWWERLYGPVTPHWRAEYFNNPWLVGEPMLTRDETDINYNWGYGAPVANVAADSFSIRWTGTIYFEANDWYTFFAASDDGVRLWVDGGLLMDQWRDQPATTFSATRYVTQGWHPTIVEYYEHSGTASIRVWWQRMTAPPLPPPSPPLTAEVIVDDLSVGFQKAGPSSSWYERSLGYNSHIFWTYNSNAQGYNSAKWAPRLPGAGNYQVYAFVPRQQADTKSARYRIFHSGQEHSYWVNQSLYFDKWASLGTYYFAATGNEYVYLEDVTSEPYASRKIGFDAVKFVSTVGSVLVPIPVPPTPWIVMPTPSASQTPVVIVVTPTPMPPPPLAPTPTPALPACSITPILGFGNVWTTYPTVRSRLGCPVEIEHNYWSGEETFVGGYMFWRSDLLLIYALYGDGTWQSFADTWHSGESEWDPTIVPPSGLYQPKRGFGKVWREQPGVRDKLGWATTMERGLGASYQGYQNGLMIWSDMQGFFVLYNDGTWSHYH